MQLPSREVCHPRHFHPKGPSGIGKKINKAYIFDLVITGQEHAHWVQGPRTANSQLGELPTGERIIYIFLRYKNTTKSPTISIQPLSSPTFGQVQHAVGKRRKKKKTSTKKISDRCCQNRRKKATKAPGSCPRQPWNNTLCLFRLIEACVID